MSNIPIDGGVMKKDGHILMYSSAQSKLMKSLYKVR